MKAQSCANCHRTLAVGLDVVAFQLGVIGTRGYVELETTVYCSEDCLREHLRLGDEVQDGERVP